MGEIKPIETVYNGYRFRSRLEARWAVFFDALGVKYEYEPEGFDLGNGQCYLPDFRIKCYGTRGEITENPFDLWVEVKGHMTEQDAAKIRAFSGCSGHTIIINCPEHGEKEVLISPRSDYDDHIRRFECPWMGWALCKYTDDLPVTVTCNNNNYVFCTNQKVKPTIYRQEYCERPILIVGDIPPHGCASDSMAVGAYDRDHGILPFNYELIDGDYFAAYPAADNGKFFLWGDDSNYVWNQKEVEDAYDIARQARFEHGEAPIIKKDAYPF